MVDYQTIAALSPVDGRYAVAAEEVRVVFSEAGLIRFRVRVELGWLKALINNDDMRREILGSDLPVAKQLEQALAIQAKLNQIAQSFSVEEACRVKEIEKTTAHDVKAVEYFLRERFLSDTFLSCLSPWIHFACTSEDINNLAYGLMLKTAREELVLPLMEQVIGSLLDLAERHAALPMLSRTHGQPASPTTVGKEIANFVWRLHRVRQRYGEITILGKANGAVGNFNAHLAAFPDVDWVSLSRSFVTDLGLDFNPYTTQIEPHDYQAEIAHSMEHWNTIIISLCRDIWSYISLGVFKQRILPHEVGSSTMPHKVNPIDFENCEGNLGLANALWGHFAVKLPISRWQRDLTDSTVMRNLGVALAHSIIGWKSLLRGLGKLDVDILALNRDLEANVEVLAEAIQTAMRRYGVADAYEQLKDLTRGKSVDLSALRQFVSGLNIPDDAKVRLNQITPQSYTGLAEKLTKNLRENVCRPK